MIDLEILEKYGLTQENLKLWLNGDPNAWTDVSHMPTTNATPVPQEELNNRERRARLVQRIRSRIQEGMNRNFADFKIFHALDIAWDTPLRGITPTLLKTFLDSDPNETAVYDALKNWGLTSTSLVQEVPDPKDPTKNIKRFNFPTFFEVVVPLVRAYVTIRRAKIMNDRNVQPFFKFEPVNPTEELSLKCEALTQRVEIMSQQYGYYAIVDQATFMMLTYGQCFLFPKEVWHEEYQLKYADAEDVMLKRPKLGEDGPASVGDLVELKVREGIRYHPPHPTRAYCDLAHMPCTFNTDSGAEYAGNWHITRFKDVYDNPNIWNKDRIALGVSDLLSSNKLFFNTVYTACTVTSVGTLPPPSTTKTPTGAAGAYETGAGAGDNDREKQIATIYYGSAHGDQGVLVTEHFEKLVPKDNGLGDYPCPIWMRFMVAGDGCTVLYAEPLPYSPVIYYGYDPDQNRKLNASLAMEVLPFQDHFSNIMTQIILTSKQNLANLTLVDEDQLSEGAIGKVENMGESFYRYLNVLRFSSRRAARGLNKISDVVVPAALPKGNVAEMINVLREILSVLERVLVMSSQEIAQAASHELRVDEVRNIQQSTSSRLMFTATPVDLAGQAHKRQIYAGLMAKGDPAFYAHIPTEIPLTPDVIEKLGFTFVDSAKARESMAGQDPTRRSRYVRAKVEKKQLAIPLWEFASSRDWNERNDNAKLGAAIAQVTQAYLSNPMTAQAIGPDQALAIGNRIFKFLGFPLDFKLRNVSGTPEQQQQQAQQQLKQMVEMVTQQVEENMKKSMKMIMDEMRQHDREIALVFKAIGLPPLNGNTNGNGNGQTQTPPAPQGGPPAAPGLGDQADPRMAGPPVAPPVPAGAV